MATCIVAIGAIFFYRYFSGENIPGQREPERSSNPRSIAILPFKNLSEDERNEYFSEGVNEAIRTNLSQVGTLRVISRTSVERYRRTEKTARDIARELDVAALLEGSIQRSKNSVRIAVRLVDGVSEVQIWAKTYERELKDVFAIQTEIAQQVADELHAKLTAENDRGYPRLKRAMPGRMICIFRASTSSERIRIGEHTTPSICWARQLHWIQTMPVPTPTLPTATSASPVFLAPNKAHSMVSGMASHLSIKHWPSTPTSTLPTCCWDSIISITTGI